MSESDAKERPYTREEARLRRNAWILIGVGLAMIPLIYLLMVKVLLPRFWIEEGVDTADVEVSVLVLEHPMTVDSDYR